MPQVSADLGEKGIKPLFASFGLQRGNEWFGMIECREAVALVGIEHGIGLEDAPVLGVGFAFGVLDLLGVALVKNRYGRFLTLADLSAELLALAFTPKLNAALKRIVQYKRNENGQLISDGTLAVYKKNAQGAERETGERETGEPGERNTQGAEGEAPSDPNFNQRAEGDP